MNIRKSALLLVLAAILLTGLFTGCSADTSVTQADDAENFAGKRLGIVTGTVFADVAQRHYPEAELHFYNASTDLAVALEQGKIDGYMLDEPTGRLILQSYADQRISALLEPTSYAYAFAKNSQRSDMLRSQLDDFIEQSRANGVLQEIDDIWFSTDESRQTVSLDQLTGENGTVRLATSADIGAPFTYFSNGHMVGYEIDLLARFCQAYGYALEITNYSFSALLPAVTSGKEDVAASTISITEERKEVVNFSVSPYQGGIAVVTKAAQNESDTYAGKNLGVVTGTVFEDVAKRLFPMANLQYYNSNEDLAEALDRDRLDAYMLDEPMGRILAQSYEDQYLSPVLEESFYGFAFAKNSEKGAQLRAELDAFLKKIRNNGTLSEIDRIWFGTDESRKTLPYDRLTGENGTVRLATSTDAGGPFAYFKDGVLVGYEADILVRFCLEKGYDLEVTDYNFSSLLTAVQSGKDDIAACALAITGERQAIMDFSLPTYDSGAVVVSKNAPAFTAKSFSGKKVGIPTGSVFDTILLKQIPDAKPEYINSYADLAVSLNSGKIDAYVADQPVARLMGSRYPDQVVALTLEDAAYAFMFPKDEKHQKLHDQFNEFLARCREDGTLAEIDDIWFSNDPARQQVEFGDLTGENGTLEMAVSSDVGAPFAYIQNGHMVGYDVDLAARFCRAYGYGLHISDYTVAGLLSATSSGKADMAASSVNITPERQEIALMSDPDYIGGVVLVTRSGQSGAKQTSFFASLGESFERTFLRENRWQLFVSGVGVTFLITAISMILGSLGGFAMYLLLRRGNVALNRIWSFFSGVMGRTPVVVILMILYYIIFGHSSLSGIWVSVIGFTVLFLCTVAGLLKMGAGAVENGQAEAALAMGYTPRQTYLRIIFPQSIEHFLPAYKNEVVTLVKGTAVVGYIAVQDLTKISDLIRARTYEAFFPLIATAIIYALLTLLLTWLIRRVHILHDPRRRDAKKILRDIQTED